MTDGTIEQVDGMVRFRWERPLRHAVDVVWNAIIDPVEIEAWFGIPVELDLKVGGEYVTYHHGGKRIVDHIVRLEPRALLEHTFWAEVNPTALVTWQLQPSEEGGCLLTLTHVLSMDDVRAAAKTVAAGDDVSTILSRNAMGWHVHLDRLDAALDGRHIDGSQHDMKVLQDGYAASLF